jgi:signal transduction histidine kinase
MSQPTSIANTAGDLTVLLIDCFGHRLALDPFRRLSSTERLTDSSNTSFSRGAGLGLSIVRSVARVHGGDVCAYPREDGGLTVKVRLPAVAEQSIE